MAAITIRAALLVGLTGTLLTGCSFTFPLVLENFGQKKEASVATLDSLTAVRAHLRDGKVVSGRYLGEYQIPQDEYERRYAIALDQYPALRSAPRAGDPLALYLAIRPDSAVTGTFVGFGGIGAPEVWLRLEGGRVIRHPLVVLSALNRPDGSPVDVALLMRAAMQGILPSLSAIAMRRKDTLVLLPADDVGRLTLAETSGGTIVAVVAGLAVDAFLVVHIVINPINDLFSLQFAP